LQRSIESPEAMPLELSVAGAKDSASVILGAFNLVIALSSKPWSANADPIITELRLHCFADARAPVAHFKVVIIRATGSSWRKRCGQAAALVLVTPAKKFIHIAR
jgi:hypothetical protein